MSSSNCCFLTLIQVFRETGRVVWWVSKESCSIASDSLPPHGFHSPWNSPGQNTRVSSFSLLQGIFPTQGSNPGHPCCRWISLPAEPSGKPKNTGVGSLNLLQLIFPTQESNQGLRHCRLILYQLSHKGSPRILEWVGSPFLLQQIFPTQESNQGLLHCRQILYQLSYQGSQCLTI